MQWKLSSSLAAIASLLLSAGDLVVAQITAPACTVSGYSWAYNSLDQSPCTVTAYMMSTCYGGTFDMVGLDGDIGYAGPSLTEYAAAGPCWCTTVAYNLASACSSCQGGEAIAWNEYTQYCTIVQPPGTFPNPVPAGVNVPHWALVAISGSASWMPSTAQGVGDTPEVVPGELIDSPAIVPSTSPIIIPTATFTTPTFVPPTLSLLPTTTAVPFSGSGSVAGNGGSKQVASAGGLVWGVTTMAAISGLVLTLIPRLV